MNLTNNRYKKVRIYYDSGHKHTYICLYVEVHLSSYKNVGDKTPIKTNPLMILSHVRGVRNRKPLFINLNKVSGFEFVDD